MLAFAQWLQSTTASTTIQSINWLIPLLQSIHILMIGVVFVSILMIALRVLGRVRADESFSEVRDRFAPWMWSALGVMLVTGALLVVGEPVREFMSLSFWLKMALLAIGVLAAGVFSRLVWPTPFQDSHGPEFSAAARCTAIATVMLWLAIIFLGRAIAYDVAIWGSLSPAAVAGT